MMISYLFANIILCLKSINNSFKERRRRAEKNVCNFDVVERTARTIESEAKLT